MAAGLLIFNNALGVEVEGAGSDMLYVELLDVVLECTSLDLFEVCALDLDLGWVLHGSSCWLSCAGASDLCFGL